jgi:prepilin-type N-terminal cleavage/methylation domain-containing protein
MPLVKFAHRRRNALTLVELLVSLAVIGMLAALLLAAVQHVRASAARTQCAANLNELMKAVLQFHAARGRYPTSYFNAAPDSPAYQMDRGWIVAVLPYMGEANRYAEGKAGNTAFHDANRAMYATLVPVVPVGNVHELDGVDYFGNAGISEDGVPAEKRIGPLRTEIPGVTGLVVRDAAVRTSQSSAIGLWESAASEMKNRAGTVEWNAYYERFGQGIFLTPTLSQSPRYRCATSGAAKAYYRGWPGNALGSAIAFDAQGRYSGSWRGQPDKFNTVLNASTAYNGPFSEHGGGVNVACLDGRAEFVSDDVDVGVFQQRCVLVSLP